MSIELDKLRITKLKEYLLNIIQGILNAKGLRINANMLSNNIDSYSLDKIPTATKVEQWITGDTICKDIFSFRSRKTYSQDMITNLKNVGFFEIFEKIIKSNNKKGILPDIKGIESIECLNCGTMTTAETKTAEFDIQIQITYKEVEE